ncbi:hypothetical protein vBPaerPs25_128 [Pseudomonas phage vB_Paer_Ps25]|uniref:Uncharacterized protein n=2 Tax=Pakpunavirus TaxID=1921407 RepID=A0AAE9KDL1_9CAUD|nr:hypothetical protein QE347_gp129 [Pseudomonas phage vB_Paer_Ps12]UOL47585.1 hypothetical protein vBPaerPs12_129 [Pseudomonas phage vB_Paer_Ps12]UOL47772.1 hypothetical protein vBPaerPs25_128 [Pseudomonas phage vB_Paer_Ps25]
MGQRLPVLECEQSDSEAIKCICIFHANMWKDFTRQGGSPLALVLHSLAVAKKERPRPPIILGLREVRYA